MNRILISLLVPCFNDGQAALKAIETIGHLSRPDGCDLEAIVADDGSTDDSVSLLRSSLPSWARVVTSDHNRGRGGAINHGSKSARGEYLLVLDADCTPASNDFLRSHLAMLANHADASVGGVHGQAEGFWGRYQSAANRRRAIAARKGSVHGLTTANMMLRATAFRQAGGFDSRYKHYGFEDRDFLLRLSHAGIRVRHNEDAAVIHAAGITLTDICRKMRKSGEFSAPLFRAAHPKCYRDLGYATIDATLHPFRAALLAPLARIILSRVEHIEEWLQSERRWYRMKAVVAQITIAFAYMYGTRSACAAKPVKTE